MKMNQQGFNLVQLLIALGMSAGVALVSLNMFKQSDDIKQKVQSSQDVQEVVRRLQGLLSRPTGCTDTLKNVDLNATGPINLNFGVRITKPNGDFLTDQAGGPVYFLKPNTYAIGNSTKGGALGGDRLIVKTLSFEKKTDSSKAVIGDDAGMIGRIKLELIRGTVAPNGNIKQENPHSDIRYIEVYGFKNAAGKFQCYSFDDETIDMEEEACTSLGGQYTAGGTPPCILRELPGCIVVPKQSDNSECTNAIYRNQGPTFKTKLGVMVQCCRPGGSPAPLPTPSLLYWPEGYLP